MSRTSDEYVAYILDLLAPIGPIETKRMFSGVVLKVDGKQLGVILEDVLYFKVMDIQLQKEYSSNGSVQFSYSRKDKKNPIVIRNWWSVPESAVDTSDALVMLAEEVLSQ